jgi:hypothetical protein
LAGPDPHVVTGLLTVPVREGLLAYVALLREEAKADWNIRRLMWAAGVRFGEGNKECPPRPMILGEDDE